MAKAHFIRFYGATEYRGRQWQTRDRVIPWYLFWQQYRAMRHAYALERLQFARGVCLGFTLATGKSTDVTLKLNDIMTEAFPET